MADDYSEFIPGFLEESFDILVNAATAMEQLKRAENIEAALDSLFRGIHTIKGGSSMFEFKNLQSISHNLETFLFELKEQFISKQISLSSNQISLIQTQIEMIDYLLRNQDQLPNSNKDDAEDSFKKEALTSDVLRIPAKRVSSVLDNIWDVFLIRNQLAYLVDQYRKDFEKSHLGFIQGFEALDTTLKRNISEIENKTMSMRMSTVKNVFGRMRWITESNRRPMNVKRWESRCMDKFD